MCALTNGSSNCISTCSPNNNLDWLSFTHLSQHYGIFTSAIAPYQLISSHPFQQSVSFALLSAIARANQDWTPEKKQGPKTFAALCQEYLRDELRRVFRLEEYAIPEQSADDAGMDVLSQNLPPEMFASLPPKPDFDISEVSYGGFHGWISNGCIITVINCSAFKDLDTVDWMKQSDIRRDLVRASDAENNSGTQTALFLHEASTFVGGLAYQKIQEITSFHSVIFVAYRASPSDGLLEARIGVPTEGQTLGSAWATYNNLDLSLPTTTKTIKKAVPASNHSADELGIQLRNTSTRTTRPQTRTSNRGQTNGQVKGSS
ncbi:hypothetical protein M5J06_11665 [Corynebacterium sp. B5-R-101]|uniref:Uncharacterized protein n=1 Tax=Corynebacterium intestinale TaxID=2943492 RepID=A0ABT0TCG4_9CORY|nr:hypothetical protein [Corynebacterium intestinale]MCL8494768.1 hypothetical protein [Corynebacterium intestinale]MCP1391004.1 hypothetical protein [Corynebacterium intestinale]